jgi:hypothetical protein
METQATQPVTTADSSIVVATPSNLSVVYEKGKKRKKKGKRRYSRRLKTTQKLERGVSKAQRRLASAVLRGVDKWRSDRDRSARKRKDGAVRDAVKNAMRAVGKTLSVASKAPSDFVDVAKPKLRTRRVLKSMPRLFR